jgi:hypothetical protein
MSTFTHMPFNVPPTAVLDYGTHASTLYTADAAELARLALLATCRLLTWGSWEQCSNFWVNAYFSATEDTNDSVNLEERS